MTTLHRLRGLRALVGDMVEHGSRAIEKVHLETADRTFTVLQWIPPISAPVHVIHAVYDESVSAVYTLVRLGNQAVGLALDTVMDVAEKTTAAGNENSFSTLTESESSALLDAPGEAQRRV